MMDLKCDWAVIDVVSVYGTDQNVTAHVTKWNIDGNGVCYEEFMPRQDEDPLDPDYLDTTIAIKAQL